MYRRNNWKDLPIVFEEIFKILLVEVEAIRSEDRTCVRAEKIIPFSASRSGNDFEVDGV